jgi:hypothetical protein
MYRTLWWPTNYVLHNLVPIDQDNQYAIASHTIDAVSSSGQENTTIDCLSTHHLRFDLRGPKAIVMGGFALALTPLHTHR